MLLIENVGSVNHIAPLIPITAKSCLVVATSRKDLSLDIAIGTGTSNEPGRGQRCASNFSFLQKIPSLLSLGR